MEAENHVAKLNEYAQKNHLAFRFEDVGSVGPDHIKTFTARVVLNGKEYPDGVGNNKKEARKNAAKNALRALMDEPTETTEQTTEVSVTPVPPSSSCAVNFVCWLNEYSHKHKLLFKPVESTKAGAHSAFHFVVGDKEYPVATGKNKKEAKEEAAKLVYQEICGNKTTETGDEKSSVTTNQQEEELNVTDSMKSPTETTKVEAGTNYIALLNNYCQKTKRFHDYIFEKRCGPSHNPQFYYKVVIDKKEYPVAEGRSVKEAKQNAAQQAWTAFQEQSDFDSKLSLGSLVSDEVARSSTPSIPSTPSPSSSDAKSESVPTTSSDSYIVFSNSPTPAKDQILSPGAKPKIKLAANFNNALRNSKEDLINFNNKKEVQSPSVTSRFTLEFDSIVRLGKGGFGRVYKARQILVDKYFAVKIVRCKNKALREVAALSELNHPNIVRYFTCWLEDSRYQWDSAADSYSSSQSSDNPDIKFLYIQMELCDTRNLRVWIDEQNTQNPKKSLRNFKRKEESLRIAEQIVSGVKYFHSLKFIHRDLKPANIMFGKEREVKIGDFGLVTDENDDDAENLVERTERKGTRSYMAPEQKNGKTYGRKVDIYSLGLIYFELLWNTGTSMERSKVWGDVRNQDLPKGFSQNFPLESQIIKSMLSTEPEDRPDVGELKKKLEEFSRILTAVKEAHRDNKTM